MTPAYLATAVLVIFLIFFREPRPARSRRLNCTMVGSKWNPGHHEVAAFCCRYTEYDICNTCRCFAAQSSSRSRTRLRPAPNQYTHKAPQIIFRRTLHG